jgi:membrane protein
LRRAQSPCGAAGALIALMFRYYSAQIFLFGTELAKAIPDERAPADTQGRAERFIKA